MADIVSRLKTKFGDGITGSKVDVLDPWVEVAPDSLIEVCKYLRDDSEMELNMCNCITVVDYLHTDEKRRRRPTGIRISKSSITCRVSQRNTHWF